MVRALIVRTNGTLEVKDIKASCKVYAEEISRNITQASKKCTYVECLPSMKGYRNPGDKKGKRRYLSCYVHEEGMIRELPLNCYAGLFAALNQILVFNMFVYGDVVVVGRRLSSDHDTDVDQYVVDLFERYRKGSVSDDSDDSDDKEEKKETGEKEEKEEFDEDAFFVALEKLDKEGGEEENESEEDAPVPTSKKTNTNDIDADAAPVMPRTTKSTKSGKKGKKKKSAEETPKSKRTLGDAKDDRPAPTKKSKNTAS